MSYTVNVTTTLVVEECCNCHVAFGVPEDFYKRRKKDHELFYCPKGHSQHYTGKTEEQKLREELEAERQRTARAKENAEYQRAEKERIELRRRATAGALTRVKNRVGNGVCPCCKRTFQQLARHMTAKHPTYKMEGGDVE